MRHPSDKLMLTMLPSSRAMLLTSFTACYPGVDATEHHNIHTTDPWLSCLNYLTKWTGSLRQIADGVAFCYNQAPVQIVVLPQLCWWKRILVYLVYLFFSQLSNILPSINYKSNLGQGMVEESCLTFCRKSTSIPGPATGFRCWLGRATNTPPQRRLF